MRILGEIIIGIPPLEPKFGKVGGNSQERMDCRIVWDWTI